MTEAIAGDFEVSVHERDRSKGDAGDIDRAIEAEQLNPRAVWGRSRRREGVGEDAFEYFGCGPVGVQGELPVAMREAQGAEVVEAQDVIGVRVGVEDGIDVADAVARRLLAEIGAGVDEDAVRTRWFLLGLPFDGDGGAEALVARRSLEVQTRQVQPRVGTPMEVPVPRKRMLALTRGRRRLLPYRRFCRWVVGVGGEGVGDLHEHHAQLEEGILQQSLFLVVKVAFRLFVQHAKHVDTLAGAEDIDAGLFAGLSAGAHLQRGGHVDRLHQLVEVHLRAAAERIARGGVGLGDHVVEFL